ncbi:MAG TPA: protein arginine kinase, partial [Planctomycetaceae bacterium]|nr:protein arginine kinase [Planctomycetaceae bacterium]
MKLDQLAARCGEWLRGEGPDSGIVISTRIRLARNLAGHRFVRKCSPAERERIEAEVREVIQDSPRLKAMAYFDVSQLAPLDRQLLVERQLISRELSEGEGARAVAIDPEERSTVMVNEEDHLRIQGMHSGFDLESAWNHINELDDTLEAHLPYAFHDRLGYLTACPTNVGTGMRVSVMLHLPALVMVGQLDRLFRSLQKLNLAVRGLYGEGSQAMGDFYQISNQVTLGKSERELMEQIQRVVPAIIEYEEKAREAYLKERTSELKSRIENAFETLQRATKISSEETMHLLSTLRMGITLGLVNNLPIPDVNTLF